MIPPDPFTAPTDPAFPSDEDVELYAIEKAARIYKRGVERNQVGWRAFHDRELQCPKWLRWLCWGFRTATTTATTTAVTQMGNDSETEGVDVNTSNNREEDVDCNKTTARRGLLDESDGLLSIPLTWYADGRNSFSETSIETIAKLFIDNDPKWEEKVIKWMILAKHQGLLSQSNLQYSSRVLGQ